MVFPADEAIMIDSFEHGDYMYLHGFVALENTGGGGGLRGPPSDLGNKGADRRETWHTPQKLRKEKDLSVIFHKNCIFY